MWDKESCWSQHLQTFLRTGSRVDALKANEAEDSPFKNRSANIKASLAACHLRKGNQVLKELPGGAYSESFR